jgi:hypothetical protein
MSGAGAVYVLPGTVLDLHGNSFSISGFDTNPDGTKGSAPTVYGIATLTGNPAGTNASALKTQVMTMDFHQVVGLGSKPPSIGETSGVDFNQIYSAVMRTTRTTIDPATYTDPSWGDWKTDNYKITYCPGDLHLSGIGQGAGVLVVDGSLTMSGTFTYVGLIVVRGDVSIVGGGAGIHTYGSVLVGQTLTAIDPSADVMVAGTADLRYSATAIAKAAALLPNNTAVLYWNDLK